jgi:putative N6-adenine-specific DNA methylase
MDITSADKSRALLLSSATMKPNGDFEIFLATAPGLEQLLCDEVKANGFRAPKAVPGGVRIEGRWHDVWRANLTIRGASRVLARLARFRVTQLTDLEKRARSLHWGATLRADVPVRVEASCSRSRIYHSGAAAERIAKAIVQSIGAPISDDAAITIAARFENDVCTVSVDTSGELLHKRGFKEAVAKAPMRENLAVRLHRNGTCPRSDVRVRHVRDRSCRNRVRPIARTRPPICVRTACDVRRNGMAEAT